MKIIIENFGPINKCEFDLEKDLHLIVGENNVGKSYAITVVYLVVKSILSLSDYPLFRHFDIPTNLPSLLEQKDKSDNQQEIDISSEICSALADLLDKTFLQVLQDSFVATFDSIFNLQSQFSEHQISLTLRTNAFYLKIGTKDKKLVISSLKLDKLVKLRTLPKQNRAPKFGDDEIIIYQNLANNDASHEYAERAIISIFFSFITEVSDHIKSVHYLPASRSGLYQALSAFGQIMAELSRSRSFLTRKIELPGISEPLSDYFLKLTEINVTRRVSEGHALNEVANKIESQILKGKVDFDTKTKKIMYTPNKTNLRLDLSSTSSMVSEIAPIVSYLRYVLTQPTRRNPYLIGRSEKETSKSKHLVLIEEPEAHLHPEVQIRMMDIFADLINHGVKVIITSHSNYIFNKANNLILENKIDIHNLAASVFKMHQNGSCGHSIDTDDLGISDENFINASELLYEEKIKLIEKINA